MSWQILACFALLYNYGFAQIVIKKIGATEGSRTRKLVYQYFFAALITTIVSIIFGQFKLNWQILIVMIIGVTNAFACYCHWRAYDISMSKTAMFSNLDDLIAIMLGYIFLGELNTLNPILIIGIIISIFSAIIFVRIKYSTKDNPNKIINWILGYSLIWGVAAFFMRFFSIRGLSISTFACAWYIGAWFGSLITRFVIIEKKEAGLPLTINQKIKSLFLAIIISTSLMISYGLRKLVPITVIQPIELISEMFIPVIIGMIVFKETQKTSTKEKIIILLCFIGVTLIAISF